MPSIFSAAGETPNWMSAWVCTVTMPTVRLRVSRESQAPTWPWGFMQSARLQHPLGPRGGFSALPCGPRVARATSPRPGDKGPGLSGTLLASGSSLRPSKRLAGFPSAAACTAFAASAIAAASSSPGDRLTGSALSPLSDRCRFLSERLPPALS